MQVSVLKGRSKQDFSRMFGKHTVAVLATGPDVEKNKVSCFPTFRGGLLADSCLDMDNCDLFLKTEIDRKY